MKRFSTLLTLFALIAAMLGPAVAGVSATEGAPCPSQELVAECPAVPAPAMLIGSPGHENGACGWKAVPAQQAAVPPSPASTSLVFATGTATARNHYPDGLERPPRTSGAPSA